MWSYRINEKWIKTKLDEEKGGKGRKCGPEVEEKKIKKEPRKLRETPKDKLGEKGSGSLEQGKETKHVRKVCHGEIEKERKRIRVV